MENYINLSLLPRKSRGIDWVNIRNTDVDFIYRNIKDTLTIVDNINTDQVLIRYKNAEYTINKMSLIKCNLGKIFNFAVPDNYKYEIGQIVNGSLKILEKTRQKKI